jgi:hypothetical protein
VIPRSDKTTMPASSGEPHSLPPAVRVNDGDLRRLQKSMEREQRGQLVKHIAQGVAGLISVGAVLHTLVGVIKSWERPPEKPTVTCPSAQDTPDVPFDGICQRLKRAEQAAAKAMLDADDAFRAKGRLERSINDVAGDVSELEDRLPPKKKKRVTTPGD